MHNQKSFVCLHQQIRKTMQKATTKNPKKGLKRYDIFKIENGILRYQGSFDTKNKDNVRMWLAENGYKGRYMWALSSVWDKIEGTNLI